MRDTIRKQILARYPDWHNKPFQLDLEEMDNPNLVYEEFFEAYSLPQVRVCLWDLLQSACQDEFTEAANLLNLYRHCERLIEASFLVYENRNREEQVQDALVHTMEIFFGVFAHEIRGQIAGVVQCSQSIQEGKDTHFYLQTINAIGHNALAILDNMLTTVQYHAGKLDIRAVKETFHFAHWIKTVVRHFETAAALQEKRICLTILPSLDNTDLTTDKVKLGQIVHNLLANALKYSYPATCIAVQCYLEDTSLVLQVANEGMGIAADRTDDLFKPYGQLGKGHSGTGLGLYLSQLYVQELGGTITVQSEEKATTIFTVQIPGFLPA
ncbi:sensor histidine kinase [Chitinophaga polysaccharea]|uniref:sensor histidine kinase n=1 Tax=Chitinophaga polysaccharea TaxID=1293035 RepID=UPI001159563E|nr:HAMP domain-containing sensor histidine kinase [Chitinophaga polysaccharea]